MEVSEEQNWNVLPVPQRFGTGTEAATAACEMCRNFETDADRNSDFLNAAPAADVSPTHAVMKTADRGIALMTAA
ncbi:unnamed protein product [Arctogadus glacialis]